MPNPNLPARRVFGGLVRSSDRRVASAVADIHAEMFVARAGDAAERDLAILKASDIGVVTRASMAEAADIASCAGAYAEANPRAAKAVAQLGETGVRGLDRRLRRFTREG
jgi:ethanolamine utilization protein EutP (predicted NTPase)